MKKLVIPAIAVAMVFLAGCASNKCKCIAPAAETVTETTAKTQEQASTAEPEKPAKPAKPAKSDKPAKKQNKTVTKDAPPTSENKQMNPTASVAAAAQPAVSKQPATSEADISPVAPELRFSRSFPRVAVVAKAADGTPAAFAETVADAVRTAIAARNIRVEPTGSESGADIRFDFVASAEPYVRDGEWVVYDASVEGRAIVRESLRDTERDASDRFVGSKTVEGRGARTLGDKDALAAAATVVAPSAAEWAVGMLTPSVCGLSAETVRIVWSNVEPSSRPALVSKAIQQIRSLPGVRDCRLVRNDKEAPLEASFQVVYIAGSLPEGLENAIQTHFPVLGL